MAESSDLEQQKDPQIHQTIVVAGNEQGQMTQDEATLYVAGTLQVRIDLFSSNLHLSSCSTFFYMARQFCIKTFSKLTS
jgi:hypothetical protein